ncbi:hypothetical protein AAHC03_012908 [Spirometra sp. Aus1]
MQPRCGLYRSVGTGEGHRDSRPALYSRGKLPVRRHHLAGAPRTLEGGGMPPRGLGARRQRGIVPGCASAVRRALLSTARGPRGGSRGLGSGALHNDRAGPAWASRPVLAQDLTRASSPCGALSGRPRDSLHFRGVCLARDMHARPPGFSRASSALSLRSRLFVISGSDSDRDLLWLVSAEAACTPTSPDIP